MFHKLKTQVQKRFEQLQASGPLFYIDIDRDLIWEKYLSGFEDPVERQGHNCNCCKSFLRQYAGICAIVDNKVQTLWDVEAAEPFTNSVKSLRNYVLSLPVTDVFVSPVNKCGTDRNIDSKNSSHIWEHFYIELPKRFVHNGSETIDTALSVKRDDKAVLMRGLEELSVEALDTVIELIDQDSLYRGKEFASMVKQFSMVKVEYDRTPKNLRGNFCWSKVVSLPQSIIRIRNTSIGTLLIHLSEGMELDKAVGKFEAVVAPTNYKRPTALVTPRMVEDAKAKLQELGYLDSLERRFAQPADFNINDLLYIDKSSSLTDVFEDMKKDAAVSPKSLTKVEEIGIEEFINNVLPKAKGIYALLENTQLNKMVTTLTSANTAPSMLKWANPFSWAYTGGITDSIKERVKNAGGKVDGEVRVSLSWNNQDDLDLHVEEPRGNHIYFRNLINHDTGGNLDVDMNANFPIVRGAVENISWPVSRAMEEGRYKVWVNNFNKRESQLQGFTVQVECRGETFEASFATNPGHGLDKDILQFDYTSKDGLKMVDNITSTLADKEKWNLKTNRFHKVKAVLLSPNCWGGTERGNKHFIFAMENCASDEPARPFFNEFLKEELAPHRKFFELLGNKLVISPTITQVAGLGFSETQRAHMYVRVEGSFKRTLKINF